MQQRMKQTILIAVLLVSVVQSKYVDYCGIEPRACAVHVFDIGGNDPNENFTCRIQPLKFYQSGYDRYRGVYKPSGEEELSAPTAVNETAVQCKLKGIQSANVTLVNGEGVALDTALIYPTLCFEECGADFSCKVYKMIREGSETMYGFEVLKDFLGCFIDDVCHVHYVFNPANLSQYCSIGGIYTWTSIALAPVFVNFASPSPVDACHLVERGWIFGTGNIKRASVPEEAGTEGLDLTADGAYYDLHAHFGFNIEANFKIYVKFGSEPITETETFFEFPSMLKIKRTPDEAIVVEYTFIDIEANQEVKIVPLTGESNGNGKKDLTEIKGLTRGNAEKGLLQLTDRANISRQETATWIQDDWNMIGFSYNMYGGGASLKWYLNGQKVEVDHGNTTGLFLRTDRGPLLSHGQFSCFESIGFGSKNVDEDEEFHTNHNLTLCMQHYNTERLQGEPETLFSECEREYYNTMG